MSVFGQHKELTSRSCLAERAVRPGHPARQFHGQSFHPLGGLRLSHSLGVHAERPLTPPAAITMRSHDHLPVSFSSLSTSQWCSECLP